MKPMIVSHRTSAPPARVFDVLSDFEKAPGRIAAITRIEMLTPGPPRVGTRFRETRTMFGKTAVEEMEVVAFDAPRSYSLRADSCGCEFVSEMRCVPDGAGTRIEMEMRSRPKTILAKVMTLLVSLMRSSMEKSLRKDLEDIARAAEAGG